MNIPRIAVAGAFLTWCSLIAFAQTPSQDRGQTPVAAATASDPAYVGSAACQSCHAPIYARWSKTRMANVVVDPKVHPEAIIPDLSTPDPLVTFTTNDKIGRAHV